MSLSVGIVGLANAGKSTLFNALLGRKLADTAPYPFCTIEPNVGIVPVPDERLEKLAEVIRPEEKIPAPIKFVDLAGLVKGAHKGEGLGNEFLSRIREVDAILHLVRAFEAPEVARAGSVDPATDVRTVNMELILKDLETVQKVQSSKLKVQNPEKYGILEKVGRVLEGGEFASEANLSEEEISEIKDLNLLTMKPQLVVLNIGESEAVGGEESPKEKGWLEAETGSTGTEHGSDLEIPENSGLEGSISLCAKLEEELSEFSPKEREECLSEMGISESGLDLVVNRCYRLLDLISFYTIKGGRTVQAWPVKQGSSVIEAAGLVHSDFAEKFIRAEVVGVSKLLKAGSWLKAREEGLVETQGRDYVVKDGDVIEFKI